MDGLADKLAKSGFCNVRPVNVLVYFWLAGLAALAAGCGHAAPGHGDPGVPRERSGPLRVAAASDLQRVLSRVLERFQTSSGTTVEATFGASGQFAEQIKAGAPFDLFLSANRNYVTGLDAAGLIVPRSVRDYARGTLVLCLNSSAGPDVKSLADLKRPEIRKIAIAHPDYAPYGVAARQALERAGLWASLESKIVRADSVRQAMTYVETGDAEAALVSKALADAPGIRTIDIDPTLHDPLIQAMGIVAASRKRDRARAFADFLVGNEGQSMLAEGGFASAHGEIGHGLGSR
jgi:molybdate transport system substrate-binding protein